MDKSWSPLAKPKHLCRQTSLKYDDDELYDAMIGIAEKRIDKAGMAAIFRKNLKA